MVQGIIAGGEKALITAVEGAEDNFDLGYEDATILTENDVAVVISASGNPKYSLGVLTKANEIKTKTIALTCNSTAKIIEEANHSICVEVGPEVITGSSRMKAGTAQKMVLNMLTTASMIKIGKTYKNFMIDLNVSNEKLQARAVRIVSEIANCNDCDAKTMLEKCNWEIKTAIVALKFGTEIDYAKNELKKYNGVLRNLLNNKKEAIE